MAKVEKKNKNSRAKNNVRLFFKTLVNNSACISAGREKPWYAALIIFFLSVIIAVIPTVVSLGNAYGSSFIPTINYNMDVALQDFVKDINNLNVNEEGTPLHAGKVLLTIAEDEEYGKRLENPVEVAGEENLISWAEAYGSSTSPYVHTYSRVSAPDEDKEGEESETTSGLPTTYRDFEICFFADADNAELHRYFTNLSAGRDPLKDETQGDDVARSISFIAFGRYSFRAQIFKPGDTTALSSYAGDYLSLETGFTLNDLGNVTITVDEQEITLTAEDMIDPNGEYVIYFNQWKEGVFDNFKEMFDLGYITNKNTSWWMTTVITLSIFIILGLFMGLVVFFITRGKRNPFRYFTFFDAYKITAWTMLSPSILTLIFGFIMSQLALVGFVLFFGMRIMWMSMRSLRPTT